LRAKRAYGKWSAREHLVLSCGGGCQVGLRPFKAKRACGRWLAREHLVEEKVG